MKALVPGHPCAPSRVRKLQAILGLGETGSYDDGTVAAVRAFQAARGLKVDGETGPKTWLAAVEKAEKDGTAASTFRRLPLAKVVLWSAAPLAKADPNLTYTSLWLRADAAEAMAALVGQAEAVGGVVTTAGGNRSLGAPVSAGRVPLSGHYLAVDFDLGTYTLMVDPERDPFVVERAPDLGPRRWRVWMRVPGGEVRELRAVVWDRSASVVTRGHFVDFTALAALYGFAGISCHASSWWEDGAPDPSGGRAGLESWHFSRRDGMEPGETTFGDQLLRLFSLAQIRAAGTPPPAGANLTPKKRAEMVAAATAATLVWANRDKVFREDWF